MNASFVDKQLDISLSLGTGCTRTATWYLRIFRDNELFLLFFYYHH